MPCRIIFSLVRESLTGDVGSEWEYVVKADLMDPMLYGSGQIEVPLPVLRPGEGSAGGPWRLGDPDDQGAAGGTVG